MYMRTTNIYLKSKLKFFSVSRLDFDLVFNFNICMYVCMYVYCVFILSAISPYTTGLKALFNQSNCTGTAPTDK